MEDEEDKFHEEVVVEDNLIYELNSCDLLEAVKDSIEDSEEGAIKITESEKASSKHF